MDRPTPQSPLRQATRISAIFLAAVTVDRLLKQLALAGRTAGPADGGVRFELFPNPNIAFSISFPAWLSLALIPIILAGFLAFAVAAFRQVRWRRAALLFGIVLAAGSNYLDRVLYGYVVDYVSFGTWFPVLNLSDVAVVAGLVRLAFDRGLTGRSG